MMYYETLKAAKAIDNHLVAVTFENGRQGVFDCAPYFSQSYWRKLKDPEFFKAAYVESGHLTWPGDIDISPLEVWEEVRPNVINQV